MQKITRNNCEHLIIFQHKFIRNLKGEFLQAYRTGNTLLWVRQPSKFRIPTKIKGTNISFRITNTNCKSWIGDFYTKEQKEEWNIEE